MELSALFVIVDLRIAGNRKEFPFIVCDKVCFCACLCEYVSPPSGLISSSALCNCVRMLIVFVVNANYFLHGNRHKIIIPVREDRILRLAG